MGFRDSETIIEPVDGGGAFDSGEGSITSTSESSANALAAADSAAAALVSENAAAADVALTAADVLLTNADVALTNADVVLTNADVVSTNADVVLTNADKIQTGLDRIATNADVVLTHADVVLAEADKVQTGLDRIAVAADLVLTNQDTIDTAADVLLTNADVALTNADVVSTNADVVLTNADKIQTGLDRVATNADVVLTNADVVLAEADKVQTGLDRIAVAADLVLTNQDTIDTAADVLLTNADVALTNADVVLTNADVVSTNADKVQTGLDRTATTNSATSAANSASTATTKASEASTSATNAATSATNAATSEVNAETAETNAETAEANALASKNAAATSETNSSNSATASANSASSAATSETNAATSASTASSQASTATTKASEASTSATSAATSASTATTKASEASTSATNAATSASNSASSATAAQTAETNAETAETNAAASATTATTKAGESLTSANSSASSASTAEAAKDAALAALDSFDDRYLGAKSSDPTVDNDGNALISGALYYNTTDDAMKVYTGSAWVAAYASLAGTLLIANNLNDLDNAVSARSNLGLVIGTNVQAFSAILAATTASYTTALNNKLSGIELGATTDQTGAEIKTAYQAEANAFTDSLYTKLDNIEELADVTDTANVVSSLTAGSNITIAADGTISGSAAYSLPTSSPTVLGGVKVGTDLSISGTGVLSIADNVIDEANLKVSNSPTNGYFLSAQSGNVGGLTWATVPAGYDDADVTSYLASASSIGIGTASPNSLTNYTGLTINNGTYGGFIDIENNGTHTFRLLSNTTATYIKTIEADPIVFDTADTERMRLSAAGDLELIQSNNLYWKHAGGGTIRAGIIADSSDNLIFSTGSSDTTRMTIDGSGNIIVGGTVDGRDVAADGTKLDGIETGATADQTAAQILTAVKTVDGSGSGLDADLLDGVQGNKYFTSYNNAGTTGWEDSNRNFRINGGGTSVGFAMHESDGTFGFNLYADGTNYGFLDANWGNWDIQKAINGVFKVDEGSGLQRVFNDGYHPNADKWTTARTLSLSGDASGSVSWDGSANVTLSVAVTNNSHDHTRLLAVDDRDMKPNTSGIGSNVKGIKAFFSSYGGMTGTANTDYQDVLVLDTYSDTSGGNANAITLDKSSSAMRIWNAAQGATSWGTPQRVFADNYHPNADILTTARTINGVSFNGSANITVADSTKLPLAGGAMTGAITTNSTFDGRDVAADGTKLDTIATNANNYSFPYTISQSAGNNTVVRRDSSGYIFSNYFNGTGTFATTGNTSGMARFTGTNGADTYGRSYTAAAARTLLNVADGANNYSLPASPSVTNLNVADGIIHTGDTNTKINMGTDQISITVGGSTELYVNTTGVRLGDSGNGYFQPVSGSYGSIQIDGGAHSGWEGYSIGGRAVFMHDNANQMGIFNDVDDEWMFWGTRNGATRMYYNGANKFETTSGGAQVNGSLAVTGTVDGRDVAADGTKLDGIAVGATNTSEYVLPASPSVTNLNVADIIYHTGDTDTYIRFNNNEIRFRTGGIDSLIVNPSEITSQEPIAAPYFEATSDINLKTNIKKIVSPLEMLSNLNGYTFNWKKDGKASAGVMAQEVEKVLPSAVSENDDGNKKVNYNELIGVLIEAIKEQQIQIDSLKNKLGE